MNPCTYFGIKEYFRRYCFDERNVPPLTPDKREQICQLQQKYSTSLKTQLEMLEDSNRVTHADLSIIINSPDPKRRT